MSKSFAALIIANSAALFALVAPTAAQTSLEASQSRSTETVPMCVAATTTTRQAVPASSTLTVYNPAITTTPSLTFYNPSAVPPAPLTFFTPLGQIDPPIRVPIPPLPSSAQTAPSTPASPSQTSPSTTDTIPSPGPCPPGTQVERRLR